ncbi:hypothetical protein REPUB_Repub16aG0109800 [Reevesia pubescens]
MDFNSCLIAFLLINTLPFSQSNNLTVRAAESISGSPSDPIPSHDFSDKLKVVSRKILRSPPPSPKIHAPYHLKSPPPSPRPPPPPSRPPPSSMWQPPI